jgi:hypothetical protein
MSGVAVAEGITIFEACPSATLPATRDSDPIVVKRGGFNVR